MKDQMNRHPGRSAGQARRKQEGAVLYIALIMLILLALIGIVGMQVVGMQERMAASFRAVNLAFQNAEATLRSNECVIRALEYGDSSVTCAGPGEAVVADAAIQRRCGEGFDTTYWVGQRNVESAPAVNVRQIDQCVVGESPIAMGLGPTGNVAPIRIYQITTYNVDSTSNRTSAAAIDSVFKL